jgi:hydrogenase expression/formation protein HypE
MEEGKLSPPALARLLHYTSRARPNVLVGAESGEDAAVVRGGDRLIVTADPITFTEENIGVYTVAVNCNDVVAMGGRPLYLTTTILLPPGTPSRRLTRIFAEIKQASAGAGVHWVGGHTEVTTAVSRIVIAAQAIGLLKRPPLLTSAARPGEALVMTKWAALEATTLIAREKPEEVRTLLGSYGYRQALRWLHEPGISILKEGRILERYRLSAAHDPTEGGIATGIHEIASRSGVGVRVFGERIPVKPATQAVCRRFGLDPLGALSSGVFLFTTPPEVARRALAALARGGVEAALIGEITGRGGRVVLAGEGRSLPRFARDEVLKLRGLHP